MVARNANFVLLVIKEKFNCHCCEMFTRVFRRLSDLLAFLMKETDEHLLNTTEVSPSNILWSMKINHPQVVIFSKTKVGI